jgi:hypothetical protein
MKPTGAGNVAVGFLLSANMPIRKGWIGLTMSALSWLILALCFAFYFTAFFLYHFMVFRVNKNLSPDERIPHSLTFGQRDRLRTEYQALYPRSGIYQMTLVCAVTLIVLAALFTGIRIWEAAAGR